MAEFERIEARQQRFIEDQKMFFVGTAAPGGRVNIAPKGMATLRVMGPNRIVWLSLTGAENETAAHLAASPRMTLMWCSVEAKPMIVRTYGEASILHPGTPPSMTSRRSFRRSPGRGRSSISRSNSCSRPAASGCRSTTSPASATRSHAGPRPRARTACAQALGREQRAQHRRQADRHPGRRRGCGSSRRRERSAFPLTAGNCPRGSIHP